MRQYELTVLIHPDLEMNLQPALDKIGKIGTAEPVDPSVVTPDTPDDEVENYISVHVHIVPWVLRTQSINF